MATDTAMERALRRMRKKRRNNPVNKKQIIISLVICLAVALFAAVFIHMEQTKQKSMQITAGNTHNVGNSYRNIVYKGQEYQYNNRITNILYAGVDSTGKLEASSQYGNKARADSIALVVMDEKNRRMTILSINRDTMTDIRRYTMNGNDKGLYTTHIGYAYSYGDGGKVSCESLCEAVSLLLGDIPVKRYVVTNQISENIGRNIRITRDDDSDHNFKLMLDDQALLGLDRSEMHLSSGEQNFISLAFALLLARHSRQEFIVLDDPISSFDSVYKNKIVFCIIKFLENKKQIILTHNTDLIRLLNVQLKDCFNLYILNNVDGGRNGFLPVKKDERNILISLSDLVKLFQNKNGTLESIIHDKRLFLMAMIPFLRGYIHIMNDPEDLYGQLSRLMHGFENGSLDIADVYKKTFGYEVEPTEIISVSDILNAPVAGLDIIDAEEYPLLADTLIQTLIYYHTRMKVESELVNIFNIPHTEGQVLLLADIIQKAFRPAVGATQEQKDKARNNRVFFTSRKTLLNEFNHFEGNMNIFQPAIDITEAALQKEVADIESKLMQLRAEMR